MKNTILQESFTLISVYSAFLEANYKASSNSCLVPVTWLTPQGLHQDVAHWLSYKKGVLSRALYWGLSFPFKMQMAGSSFPFGI